MKAKIDEMRKILPKEDGNIRTAKANSMQDKAQVMENKTEKKVT